jgi:hypothetical protein
MTAPAMARRWPGSDAIRLPARTQAARDWALGLRRHAPLAAVLLTGLIVQAAVTPHLALRGAAPEVLLVVVVAVAVEHGPRAGAGFGFAAGLGADLFLSTPLGTAALAFTLIGHVLGQSRRPRSHGVASALCSPSSSCFTCRTGRAHNTIAANPTRSERTRRRVEARRAALRRSLAFSAFGVAAGQLGTAAVATALAGLPFPALPALVHMAGVAAASAPLGPAAFAVVRRLPCTGDRR